MENTFLALWGFAKTLAEDLDEAWDELLGRLVSIKPIRAAG